MSRSSRPVSSALCVPEASSCLMRRIRAFSFFFNNPAPPGIYTLSLHDALPIWECYGRKNRNCRHNHDGASYLETYQKYGCGPVRFSGTDNALYARHQVFDNFVDLTVADGAHTEIGRAHV